MGCCCSKRQSNEEVEMPFTATNAAVSSRVGKTGKDIKVKVEKGCYHISGSGVALGSCVLECDSAYWEVKLGDKPLGIQVGVKRINPKQIKGLEGELDEKADPVDAWCFSASSTELKTGDVIGVYWDQIDLPMLSFSVNGNDIKDASYLRVRPSNDVIPAVSVIEGSSCQFIFNEEYFTYAPKSSRYGMIVCATNLI